MVVDPLEYLVKALLLKGLDFRYHTNEGEVRKIQDLNTDVQ